ncbi:MAG: hypothetical protein M1816_007702 [Peltula sp. TS41687]|nr:MAG: hypothetical protein M1816_007702 [Peltula sp. TS41687]
MHHTAEDDTAVIVTTKKVDQVSWNSLMDEINDICKPRLLNVEFVDGVVSRAPFLSVPYTKKPTNGASVWLSGLPWTSGTIGGFVEFDVEGKDYHEAVPPDMACRDLRVDQPSVGDHLKAVKATEAQVAGRNETIQQRWDVIANGMSSSGILRGLKANEDERDLLVRQMPQAMSFDRGLGSILVTSGYRVSGNGQALD